MIAPRLEMEEVAEFPPGKPALPFEIGFVVELGRVAEAAIGDWLDVVGDAKNGLEVVVVEDADPPHANVLGSGCQPEGLYRASGAVQVHFGVCCSAEHNIARPGSITRHDDPER